MTKLGNIFIKQTFAKQQHSGTELSLYLYQFQKLS